MLLVEQPTASPELKLAERIGEEVRKKIKRDVYGTIWSKMADVERLLEKLAADPLGVKHIVGWVWIIRYCQDLPRKGPIKQNWNYYAS